MKDQEDGCVDLNKMLVTADVENEYGATSEHEYTRPSSLFCGRRT